MAEDEIGSSEKLGNIFDLNNKKLGALASTAASFAKVMTTAFMQSANSGKQFDEVLKSLALRMSDNAVNSAFQSITSKLPGGLGSMFSGFNVANMIKPFADGGVVGTPTYFPLPGGAGFAGEAGPEAIMPLARGSDGRLGVAAGGPRAGASITVNIATPDAESFRRSESYITGQIARAVARGQRSL
ncbi:MAG: phage tail tape measure protein [Pseudomonadota bacterium]